MLIFFLFTLCMKKLIILLLLVIPSLLHAQTISKLDDKYGFRDIVFDKPISNYKGMALYKTSKNGVKLYQRKTDKLAFGEFELANINYIVYSGKVVGVAFNAKGEQNSEGVLGVLQKTYGPGEKQPEKEDSYIWIGNKLRLSYSFNSEIKSSEVELLSKEMENI